MASAHIQITGTAGKFSADVRSWLNRLQGIVDDSDQLKAVADQIALGGDWSTLATYLGVTDAEAEAFYNMLGSAEGELNATFITQILARCGG